MSTTVHTPDHARTTASLPPARRWGFLVLLSLGLFLVGADNSILYTALPELRAQLHTTDLEGLWIINAYPLVLCGLLLGTGTLGDRIGHRLMFIIGVTTFGVGSLLAALAPNAEYLIGARAVLGVAAATMMPATLALISQIFPDERERATAIGVWVSVAVVGSASGPVLGGLLLEHYSWHSVFLINVPVAAVALVGTLVFAPPNMPDRTRRWDFTSSLFAMFAMVGMVMGIKELANPDRSMILFAAAVAVGCAGASAFRRRQRLLVADGREPLLEFGIFRDRMFTGGTVAAVLAMFVMAGAEMMTTQRYQTAGGFSPLEAGLLVASAALPAIPASVLGGAYLHRVGFRTLISGGFLIIAAGLGVGMWAFAHAPLWAFVLCFVAIGAGAGMVMSVSSTAIIGSAPQSKAGMASAVEEVSYEFGTLVSVSILGSLMPMFYALRAPEQVAHDVDLGVDDPVFGADAVAAYDSAYLYVLAIICGVALVAAALTARCFAGNPKGTVAHQ
ncbi:MFS transporter [uncultured Corynebacterium sp.]|uniref:MFS transporter n=1 Tax=uncultured Corynebacterium sp. TaxID=159447 RepID=UPI0025E31D26|nr:MFS transporter [uncultured Corynebacterium sp.]